jgi:hypothetical protein
MSKFRTALLPLALAALTSLIASGCEGVPHQTAYPAGETGFCEQVEEIDEDCIQPLDMTVDVHE